MFFRRGVADDDPWLRPKMWLFSAGAILALVGMGTSTGWLIGSAGVLLAIGLLLRFVPHPDRSSGGAADPAEDASSPELPDRRRHE